MCTCARRKITPGISDLRERKRGREREREKERESEREKTSNTHTHAHTICMCVCVCVFVCVCLCVCVYAGHACVIACRPYFLSKCLSVSLCLCLALPLSLSNLRCQELSSGLRTYILHVHTRICERERGKAGERERETGS